MTQYAIHHWFVLKVMDRHKPNIMDALQKRAIHSVMATKSEWVRKPGKRRKVFETEDKLPGYLLVRFERPADTRYDVEWFPWGLVLQEHGVEGVLGHKGIPVQAGTKDIERFLGIEKPAEDEKPIDLDVPEHVAAMKIGKEYKIGDQVRSDSEVFRGFEGKVIEFIGPDAKVLLSIFGRETPFRAHAGTFDPVK